MTMQPLSVGFHRDAHHPEPYGLMPIGERQRRAPTIAEVVHFETCHAAGPYSAVNLQVPAWVPVWQYVEPEARAVAERKREAFSKATHWEATARSLRTDARQARDYEARQLHLRDAADADAFAARVRAAAGLAGAAA